MPTKPWILKDSLVVIRITPLPCITPMRPSSIASGVTTTKPALGTLWVVKTRRRPVAMATGASTASAAPLFTALMAEARSLR